MYFRVVPIAMDRAIKEIVSGIVQRSVSIATQTTKELVLKVCELFHFSSLLASPSFCYLVALSYISSFLLFKFSFSRLFVSEIVTSMSCFKSVDSNSIYDTFILPFNIL